MALSDKELFELAQRCVEGLKDVLVQVRRQLLEDGYHYPNDLICFLTNEIGDGDDDGRPPK